jgi:hypothetical protein
MWPFQMLIAKDGALHATVLALSFGGAPGHVFHALSGGYMDMH